MGQDNNNETEKVIYIRTSAGVLIAVKSKSKTVEVKK